MLYQGSAIKRFLIERLAMGVPMNSIKNEFMATQGIALHDKDIDAIVGGCEEEIKFREKELLEELSSSSFIASIYRIKAELNEVRELAKEDGDLRSYAQLTNTLLKSVNALIRLSTDMANKKHTSTKTLITNNILVINTLENDGVIEIKDKKRLENLLGAGEISTIESKLVEAEVEDVEPEPEPDSYTEDEEE